MITNNKKQIRFFTFEQFHNRANTGSTFIRVKQLLKYWPEAGLYKYGENPDVLVFQKVYCSPDYKFPAHFEGKKILDICDPDWFDGIHQVKETVDAVDAVTCPTEHMAKFMRQLTDKPVRVIKDRFDIDTLPQPKKHEGDAKTVVWFGYKHNAELLKPAMNLIDKLQLNLTIIADDDPNLFQWSTRPRQEFYKFHKYDESKFYEWLQEADFAVLPLGSRPQDKFKSNNKTVKALLAGLPVAKDSDEVEKFMSAKARQNCIDKQYDKIKAEYDVRNSVKEMKELIESL